MKANLLSFLLVSFVLTAQTAFAAVENERLVSDPFYSW
jgi:hypothetical protein